MPTAVTSVRNLVPTVVASQDEFDRSLLLRAREAREMLRDRYGQKARELDAELWAKIESALRTHLGPPSPGGRRWGWQAGVWGDGIQPLDISLAHFSGDLLGKIHMLLTGRFHGFSAVVFVYDGPLGSGALRTGALWMNATEVMATRAVARTLSIGGQHQIRVDRDT